MDLSKIIFNSIKYPFKNIAKLPIIFTLFILIAIIPIGKLLNNNYLMLIGGIAFFVFILIVPGYFLNIIKIGSRESAMFPSFNLVNDIYDSIMVLVLRMVYMIVPVAMFFILLSTVAPASFNLLNDFKILSFLATFGLLLVIILVTYLLFEFLLFFAKARLAYHNSLSEALKVNKVIEDIRNIGIFNIIKWVLAMIALAIVVSVVSSFVITIPYVGILIDICVIVPIMESIASYSVGLLYSNIT
ncbi:MAG: DUF4013 domain-containing protein [Methanobrevibacter thaueri]|uniref:DUF4013 domain-containing protein n=1 Tax=Methanobrevibacter thaueri TaxID=190975 RepID=UPI0026EB5226|nr:DUF4013 domain-containing protein [Methanobrevibacter thaueri]MBE6495527.1 DUF4013 domain-containing protein [Methanobrevibacter thaueri]